MDNYKIALRKNILIIVIALLICILVPSVITLSVTGIIEADISDELIDGRRIDVKYRHAVKSVDINKFIVMVLADRLDMSSQIEVLKAESIMVRTDIYRIMGNDMNIDSSQLGMSFLTENQMKNNWGSKYNDNYNLISDCVAATGGIIMMYNGSPIDARYTEVSCGTTLAGSQVLGAGYDYLTEVDCPDDMHSSDYISVVSFSYKEFVKKMSEKYKDIGINETAPFKSIQIAAKSQSGYVTKIQVGNVVMTGAEFAYILGINSANMTIEDINGSIKITTKGKGSNIGLSMYTAGIMAETGNTYETILNKFYCGVTLVSS